jgi:hypothetical protein
MAAKFGSVQPVPKPKASRQMMCLTAWKLPVHREPWPFWQVARNFSPRNSRTGLKYLC